MTRDCWQALSVSTLPGPPRPNAVNPFEDHRVPICPGPRFPRCRRLAETSTLHGRLSTVCCIFLSAVLRMDGFEGNRNVRTKCRRCLLSAVTHDEHQRLE